MDGIGADTELTQAEIDLFGASYNLDHRMPSVGRGKQAAKTKLKIAKSAARQALGGDDKSSINAALAVVATQADTKAIASSIKKIDNQLSSMGSFVTNLNSQIDRVRELSEDLKTFDTRLLHNLLKNLLHSL